MGIGNGADVSGIRPRWTGVLAGERGPSVVLTALVSTVAASFAAHGFLFTNEFFSHDSITWSFYSDWGLPFYTSVGRCAIPFYEALKGGVASPWLIGLLFLLWMALAGVLTARLLDLRRPSAQVLLCALLCTNVSLSLTGATYVYCLDEYALALLAAAAAALLFRQDGLRSFWGVGALVLCLFLYQPYFTVAAALCLLAVMRDAARGRDALAVLRSGLRCLGLLAVSFAVYWTAWQAVCAAVGVEPSRSASPLSGWGGLFREIYGGFFRSLLDPGGVLGSVLPAVHVTLLGLLLWRLAVLLADRRLPWGDRILLGICVLLLPAALRSAVFLIPDDAHDLTLYARELFYVLAVFIMDPVRRPGKRWISVLGYTAAATLLGLTLWHHVVFANQAYMKKDLEKSATAFLAARIVDRIEAVDGYVLGETPVAFAGRVDYNTFLRHPLDAFEGLSDRTGLWHDYAATYNLGRYLTEYLHYPLLWDTSRNYTGLPEVREMPVFPAAGSVKMVDGTVVVKFTWVVTGDAEGHPLPSS